MVRTFRSLLGQASASFRKPPRSQPRLGSRPQFETLEDRLAPAGTITVIPAAAGSGSLDGFLSATDGTIESGDGGAGAGTVSTGALTAVNATTEISVIALNSIVFNEFENPLTLQTNAAHSATFVGFTGSISFDSSVDLFRTSGGSMVFAASTSLALPRFETEGGAVNLTAASVGVPQRLTTNGGNIVVTANVVDLGGPLQAGAGRVTVRPSTAGRPINLGTEIAGSLSLTDAEIDKIEAGVLEIGRNNAGAITISAAMSPASADTLKLVTASTVAETGAGNLVVANLAVVGPSGVTLDSAANNVSALAGSTTAADADFRYRDATGFVIDTVDGVVGLACADLTTPIVRLNAGGAVSQTSGADVVARFLELLGAGPYTLNNAGNDVATLAANLTAATTGTLNYTDADALNIGTAGGTTGITTNDSNVTIATVNGALRVLNDNSSAAADIDVGDAVLALTAGSVGIVDQRLEIFASAGIVGAGGVTLVGDNIVIAAAVNAGIGSAVLRQAQNGTLINLGGADAANTLGLTDAELDLITAGTLQIGNGASGNITISAAINAAGTLELQLFTGGAIADGAGALVTESRLALTATSGIGSSGNPLDTAVANLEAQTATGGIFINNTGVLNIGGLPGPLQGVQVTTSGNLTVTNNAGIILNGTGGEDIRTAAGNVLVSAVGTASDIEIRNRSLDAIDSNNGNVRVQAGRDILLGSPADDESGGVEADGDMTLAAGRDIIIDENSDVRVFGAGGVIATAGRDIAILASDGTNGSTIATQGGAVSLTAGPNGRLTIDSNEAAGAIRTTAAGGNGDITINADRMNITVSDALNAGAGIVTIQPVSAGRLIDLGSATDAAANTLELSDAELDRITAGALRIGDTVQTGNISITAAISPANAATLLLRTGDAILDGTAAEQPDIIVTNLVLSASAGIGSADDIDTSVTNLAFRNFFSAVDLRNTGNLTLNASSNGIIAVSTLRATVQTAGSLTVAGNVTSGGALTLVALDAANAGQDLTIHAGVLLGVSASGANLILQAGDNLTVHPGAILSTNANGAAVLSVDVDNLDSGVGGVLVMQGTINAGSAQLNGNADADFFLVRPSAAAGSVLNVSGNAPTTLPGDRLQLDLSGGATGTVLTTSGVGAGTYTFTNRANVVFEEIELLPPIFVAGADANGPPLVKVFDAGGLERLSFQAFAPSFKGGVRVALGDVNGDGAVDIIAAQGAGARPAVKIIDGAKLDQIPANGQVPASAVLGTFFVQPASFKGGLFVAAGDVNADGRADIVVGLGSGNSPRVMVVNGAKSGQAGGLIAPGALLGSFLADVPGFKGGVTVAAGDVNGDGRADIITGLGAGNKPRVKVVDANRLKLVKPNGELKPAALLGNFLAFGAASKRGVFVAAGDVNGDGRADIIAGAGAKGLPEVKVIDGTKLSLSGKTIAPSAVLHSLLAFVPSFKGGVRVGAADIDGDGKDDLLLGAGVKNPSLVRVLHGVTLAELDSFFALGALKGAFVAGA